MEEEGIEWLVELLHQVQLEQFFVRIRDELQVSRLQHFEYVQPEDLEKIGMSKPAAKRLLDIIKRKRLKSKLTKFLPGGRFGTIKKSPSIGGSVLSDSALTCLIQVKGFYYSMIQYVSYLADILKLSDVITIIFLLSNYNKHMCETFLFICLKSCVCYKIYSQYLLMFFFHLNIYSITCTYIKQTIQIFHFVNL